MGGERDMKNTLIKQQKVATRKFRADQNATVAKAKHELASKKHEVMEAKKSAFREERQNKETLKASLIRRNPYADERTQEVKTMGRAYDEPENYGDEDLEW